VTRALHIVLLAVALAVALAAVSSAAELDEALASLRNTVAKHPDDPDVSWALADALEAAERSSEAADHMQRHLARWPERPAHGWRALGRCAYGAGRVNEAIAALARALVRDEADAEAHLYMGLALQRKGEKLRAEAHFEAAARDPELAPDALLLSGISRVGRGDADVGRARLQRVIDLAPQTDSALDARALLDDTGLFASRLSIESFAGVGYDSNATLGSRADVPGASSAEDDALFEFGTDVSWRPRLIGERDPLELDFRYVRRDYARQTDLAEQLFRAGFRNLTYLHPRVGLETEGSGGPFLVDNDLYGVSGGLRQSLLVALGRRTGVLRVYANGERAEYEDAPFVDSLERDGWVYGGGAEHVVRLGRESDLWLAWGGRYSRRDTEAGRDELGFEGAYDADLWQGSLRLAGFLPFEVRARAELYFDAHLYDNPNLIDALSEGLESPSRRRDMVWTSLLTLRRALYRNVELELYAQFADIDSNVDLYSYRRGLTGMRLRAALP
jgi:tetratricopeptide (TPR) repeat protein